MSYNDLLCLSALPLQQVNAVIQSLEQYLPTFALGTQVINVEENERYTWITIGTICGFDYINHPHYDDGWFYHVDPQFSEIYFRDGLVQRGEIGTVYAIPQEELRLVNQIV